MESTLVKNAGPPKLSDILPLDLSKPQLRLLAVEPDNKSLRLSVHDFSDDSVPEYEAVSYTWGPSSPTFDYSFVNPQYKTAVRKNLDFILRSLINQVANPDTHFDEIHPTDVEDMRPGKTFWIDALCIDQANDEERAQQIGIMGNIYKNARAVLVFPGADYTPALASIRSRFCSPHPVLTVGRLSDTLHLARSPYWSRIWIVQELAFAKKIILAAGFFRWHISEEHLQRIEFPRDSKPALIMANRSDDRDFKKDLAFLINDYGDFECADARDKVYALLSLWETQPNLPKREEFEADYTLTHEELHKKLERLYADHPLWAHGLRKLDKYLLEGVPPQSAELMLVSTEPDQLSIPSVTLPQTSLRPGALEEILKLAMKQ